MEVNKIYLNNTLFISIPSPVNSEEYSPVANKSVMCFINNLFNTETRRALPEYFPSVLPLLKSSAVGRIPRSENIFFLK